MVWKIPCYVKLEVLPYNIWHTDKTNSPLLEVGCFSHSQAAIWFPTTWYFPTDIEAEQTNWSDLIKFSSPGFTGPIWVDRWRSAEFSHLRQTHHPREVFAKSRFCPKWPNHISGRMLDSLQTKKEQLAAPMVLFWAGAVLLIEQSLLIPHGHQTDTQGSLVPFSHKNTSLLVDKWSSPSAVQLQSSFVPIVFMSCQLMSYRPAVQIRLEGKWFGWVWRKN